jgi:hypothetical protein
MDTKSPLSASLDRLKDDVQDRPIGQTFPREAGQERLPFDLSGFGARTVLKHVRPVKVRLLGLGYRISHNYLPHGFRQFAQVRMIVLLTTMPP